MNFARILIVEDEIIEAYDIKMRLESLGHEVLDIVAEGEKGIQRAETLKPDLILMDIGLKGEIDGISATRYINLHLKIPVIYISANTDDYTWRMTQDTIHYGYLLKPIGDVELEVAIRRALTKHGLEIKNCGT